MSLPSIDADFDSVVDGEKLIRWGGGGDIDGIDVEFLELAPPLFASFLSRAIHEDAPHRFGSGSKEMAAAVPVLGLFHIDQPDICVMHQCGRLQGLPWLS